MPRNSSPKKERKSVMDFDGYNKYAEKFLSMLDRSTSEVHVIDEVQSDFQKKVSEIVDKQAKQSPTGIIDFIRNNQEDFNGKTSRNTSIDIVDTITQNADDMFGILSTNYQSMYAQMNDIDFVIKFNPGLQEAINTALNYICSPDDINDTVLMKFDFGANWKDEEKQIVNTAFKNIDNAHKFKRKLKNGIIKNSLKMGTAYAYIISYNKLFAQYESKLKKKSSKREIGAESIIENISDALQPACESYSSKDIVMESELSEDLLKECMKDKNIDMEYDFPSFTFIDSEIPSEIFNDMDAFESVLEHNAKKKATKSKEKKQNVEFYSDGVMEEEGKKFGQSGTFFKVLDCKRITPIEIFNTPFGYLYIHGDKKKFKNRIKSRSQFDIMAADRTQGRKDAMFDRIIDGLCMKIAKKFNVEFVKHNSVFKMQLAECISSYGLTNSNYKIQFIPAEDIIAFPIKIDEDGDGHSMIENSVVYGKMVSSLILSKLLNYLNKSGDKTIVNFRKSPIDRSGNEAVDEIIRQLQGGDINLPDLLSGDLLFGKIGRNGRLTIPRSDDDQKLIDFEQLEGQRIDLNTEYEEYLNKLTIMGSSTPSTILDTTDQIDFARQITTTNIKYAAFIASLQADLEDPITESIRRFLTNEELGEEINEKLKSSFYVRLIRPKVLSNNNINQAFGDTEQMAEAVSNLIVMRSGVTEDNPDFNKIKSKLKFAIIKSNMTYLDWDGYETMFKECSVEHGSDTGTNSTAAQANSGF